MKIDKHLQKRVHPVKHLITHLELFDPKCMALLALNTQAEIEYERLTKRRELALLRQLCHHIRYQQNDPPEH